MNWVKKMSNKNYNIVKIVLLSIILFLLCGFFVSLMIYGGEWNSLIFKTGDKMNKVMENDYNVSDVKTIESNLREADITFSYSNTDQIKVVVYDKKDDTKVNVSLNDGVLRISFDGPFICFGFCYYERKVEVYLPDNFDGNLDLTSASGDVTISNFPNSNVKVKTASGDVQINEANKVEVKTASGDVDIFEANTINVSTISGDVEINSANEIIGSTTSGDVEISEIKEVIDFTSVSGEIDIIHANLIKNSKLSTVSGDIEIESLNPIYVSTKTTSGDVMVRGDDRRSNIELSVKTTSGDIEIN